MLRPTPHNWLYYRYFYLLTPIFWEKIDAWTGYWIVQFGTILPLKTTITAHFGTIATATRQGRHRLNRGVSQGRSGGVR